MTIVPIKYIGTRQTYKDGACGSGIVFTQGQTQQVSAKYAVLMLKHPSVYVRGDDDAPMALVADELSDDEKAKHDMHDTRDLIQRMDKDALKMFAKTNWGIDLDGRKSQDNLRAEVLTTFERLGVAP